MQPYYAHVEFDENTRMYFGVILDIPGAQVVAETVEEVGVKLHAIVMAMNNDGLFPVPQADESIELIIEADNGEPVKLEPYDPLEDELGI